MTWEYRSYTYMSVATMECDPNTGREDHVIQPATEFLNKDLEYLGPQGWELVSVVGMTGNSLYAVFKRPATVPTALMVPGPAFVKEVKAALKKSKKGTSLVVGGEGPGIKTETPIPEGE